jgi:hypothetical protein
VRPVDHAAAGRPTGRRGRGGIGCAETDHGGAPRLPAAAGGAGIRRGPGDDDWREAELTADHDTSQAPQPPRWRERLARAYARLLGRLGWLPTAEATLGDPGDAIAGEGAPGRGREGRADGD